jgi:hypothetical protein
VGGGAKRAGGAGAGSSSGMLATGGAMMGLVPASQRD